MENLPKLFSIQQLIKFCNKNDNTFFDKENMEFFNAKNTKHFWELSKNKYLFVTSEKFKDYPRRYTIRVADIFKDKDIVIIQISNLCNFNLLDDNRSRIRYELIKTVVKYEF